jgi:hypothetical protein
MIASFGDPGKSVRAVGISACPAESHDFRRFEISRFRPYSAVARPSWPVMM